MVEIGKRLDLHTWRNKIHFDFNKKKKIDQITYSNCM